MLQPKKECGMTPRRGVGPHKEAAMGATAGIRMKRPAHPGGFVKHEIIEPLELSVTAAAQALGVTRATLSTLLNERASLSPEMALRIEKGFRRIDGHADANAEQL